MDERTIAFLQLSSMNDLVQLAADRRAAWLWSSDGSAILWANAAGARFFSCKSVSDLENLPSLDKSPARQHIARIADAGQEGRFSTDRLRFYRGLRMLLLTCQCKRVVLANGDAAALIICTDKGLMEPEEPVGAFGRLLTEETNTVFLLSGREVTEKYGTLDIIEDIPEVPDGSRFVSASLASGQNRHAAAAFQIPAAPLLLVVDNQPMSGTPDASGEPDSLSSHPLPAERDMDQTASADEPMSDASAGLTAASAVGVAGALAAGESFDQNNQSEEETVSEGWVRADAAELETEAEDPQQYITNGGSEQSADDDDDNEDALTQSAEEPVMDTQSPTGESDVKEELLAPTHMSGEADEPVAASETSGAGDSDNGEALTDEKADLEEATSDDAPLLESGFVFQPRRRPVRFAWKMDVNQRFTFLSDEFADVLGEPATDITGQTWQDVSQQFDLDARGSISRALERRDTWSGKTVYWPVTGAALRVPVDLAALPAFDRNRKFDGYRGFGVCRTADAIEDRNGILVPAAVAAAAATGVAVASSGDALADEDIRDDHEVEVAQETVETPALVSEPEQTGEEAGSPSDLDVSGNHAADHSSDEALPSDQDQQEADDLIAENEPHEEEADTVGDAQSEGDQGLTVAQDQHVSDDAVTDEAPGGEVADVADDAPSDGDRDMSGASKTFLGASAVALVSSLAKMTGKNASPEDPTEAEETSTPREDMVEELRAAAAALDEHAAGDDGTEVGDAPSHAEVASDTSAERKETDRADEPYQDAVPQETEEEDDLAITDAEPTDETVTLAPVSEPETAPANVGITGPAALRPDEIETAVKSLAKSIKAQEAAAASSDSSLMQPKVFEAEAPLDGDLPTEEITDAQDAGSETLGSETAAVVEDMAAGQAAAGLTAPAEEEAESLLPFDEPDIANGNDDLLDDASEEAFADDVPEDVEGTEIAANADLTETVPDTEIAAQNEARDPIEHGPGTTSPESAGEDDGSMAEALDPVDETSDIEPEGTAKTGEVIPLATVHPGIVPVDTTGLSRPERQAFRKIAEALGARFEGNLDDYDDPAPEEEPLAEVPAEEPEAGPIDPSLLDRLPTGIAIVHDREVLYANKALLKMLGYSSHAELSEAGGLEALFIDTAEELPDATGTEDEFDETLKMRRSDGGVLNVDAHMHSVPWNGSNGLMISVSQRPFRSGDTMTSVSFDADTRAELENAQDQIAEMDTILETATDGVLVLDGSGKVLKVNGSAEALFAASREDLIGAPVTDFLAPESHKALSDYLDGLSQNGVASILNDGREVLGKVPTGGLIPLFLTIGRINGTKDPAKYCAVLRDITQWKSAEEELTQAKRQAENASSQKSDFLAKISHEIRTPLNAIIGFSEVMMEERFGPIGNDRYKDYLRDIRTSGSHIMSLINDLLDLSKIEAGKLDLQFSAVSTSEVINECVALMQPQANRDRVIIRASLPDSVPNVVADPRSLRQIVLNLLSNAIKYNKSGGQVILSTALESSGEVALRVRDTGSGMTSKQLAAALEPFRQLHTTARGGGTGLGLPLTKALVEANRASFHIDSTPDQGTLVEILFPTQRVLSE